MLDVKENRFEDRIGGRPGPTEYEQVMNGTAQHHDLCNKGHSSEERIEGGTDKKRKKKKPCHTQKERDRIGNLFCKKTEWNDQKKIIKDNEIRTQTQ